MKMRKTVFLCAALLLLALCLEVGSAPVRRRRPPPPKRKPPPRARPPPSPPSPKPPKPPKAPPKQASQKKPPRPPPRPPAYPPPLPPPPSPAPPAPAPPPADYLDVWILAGGSNTVGENGPWDQEGSNPECTDPRPKQIMEWSLINQRWEAARHNVHFTSQRGDEPTDIMGPDISFARNLIDMGVSTRVGLVPCGMGGTNLYTSWVPPDMDMYQRLVAQTKAAMKAAGKDARLRGMYMILGEGDAMMINNYYNSYNPSGKFWAGQYVPLMKKLILALRTDLAAYNTLLPVILVKQAVTNRDRVFPFIGTIRSGTENMVMDNLLKADMEGCPMYLVDFTGFDGYMGIGNDVGWQAVHLSRNGQCCMGARMAQSYKDARSNLTQQAWQ